MYNVLQQAQKNIEGAIQAGNIVYKPEKPVIDNIDLKQPPLTKEELQSMTLEENKTTLLLNI